MRTRKQKLTRADEKLLILQMIELCQSRAAQLMAAWKVVDKTWPTKNGSAYIRLSTEDQVLVAGGSLEQQINLAFEDVARRSQDEQINYRIVEVFIDAGISGQTDNRPELQRLQSLIRRQKFSFVAMKDMTRIFRHAVLFSLFFEECNKAGCEVMFKGFPINPNDPNDVLRLRFHAAMAEYEARNTSKRVRENVYSAMLYNGKFNSTHKVLGLDQLVVGGNAMVGLYQPNHDELKIVMWIMETFVKVGSYQVTLAEIGKRGINNKNGRPFKENSLHTLLTNQKYIGKWELNPANKDKNTRKLMPYDQNRIVDLPHGCVVDIKLWERVQETVSKLKGNKAKNTRLQRIYPLSGLLRYGPDGSNFGGSGNWGKSKRCDYYMNAKNNVRLPAEAVEIEARKIVTEILKESPKLRNAIIERIKLIHSSLDLLKGQIQQLDARVSKLQNDRCALDKRLDFLLSSSGSVEAEAFRNEYVESVKRITVAIEDCERQRVVIERGKKDLQEDELDSQSLVARAEKIQAIIQERDPVALKNAYKALFEVIEVGALDKNGRRELRFKIKGSGDSALVGNRAEQFSIDDKMAQAERFELPTNWLTANCSTTELRLNSQPHS